MIPPLKDFDENLEKREFVREFNFNSRVLGPDGLFLREAIDELMSAYGKHIGI